MRGGDALVEMHMPKAIPEFYIPARRTRWLEWQSEDDDSAISFRAKVRADLTFGEVDSLQWDGETKMADLQEMFAPYVIEWNVGRVNAKGQPEAVPAPADGGGAMFREVPVQFFWWLVREIKLNSTKQPDPKSSAPAAATAAPSADAAPVSA